MRTDDMLRVSLRCATLAAHGGEWAAPLARGAASVVGTDASFAVCITVGPDPSVEPRADGATVGIDIPAPAALADAGAALPRHPTLGGYDWTRSLTARVSDAVRLEEFWTTDVWRAVHGYADGRYPASVIFGRFGPTHVFLGVQRRTRDFSDEDMVVLDRVREPLSAALAFRYAWDAAAASLDDRDPVHWNQPLTQREKQVAALVSWGWTDGRIATHLGISERTVRKHLENVRMKWQAPNRAAVAALFQRHRD